MHWSSIPGTQVIVANGADEPLRELITRHSSDALATMLDWYPLGLLLPPSGVTTVSFSIAAGVRRERRKHKATWRVSTPTKWLEPTLQEN